MRKEPGPVAWEGLDEEVAAAGADYDLARGRVRSIVEGPTLERFLRRVTDYRNRTYPAETKRVRKVRMKDEEKARIGHLFVAALNDPAREALPPPTGLDSTPTRLVRLSPETAVKQVINHRDLTTADYRQIPDVIERGDFGPDPQKDGRVLVFLRTIDDRYAYKAVIKQTPNNEVFLLSFRTGKIAELTPLPSKEADSTSR